MEGNAGCIDLRALERLRTLGGGELLTNMVHLFISHAEPVLRDAEIALERGDLEGVRRAAHSLKSSAANLEHTRFRILPARLRTSPNMAGSRKSSR